MTKGKKMTILVIGVPWYKKDSTGKSIGKPGESHSWETYFQTGVGKGYAIPQKGASGLTPGSKVVLLRNDKNESRAEGSLVKLVYTGRTTTQGIKRYDVHFIDQKKVPYTYNLPNEKLSRQGVAVYWSDC